MFHFEERPGSGRSCPLFEMDHLGCIWWSGLSYAAAVVAAYAACSSFVVCADAITECVTDSWRCTHSSFSTGGSVSVPMTSQNSMNNSTGSSSTAHVSTYRRTRRQLPGRKKSVARQVLIVGRAAPLLQLRELAAAAAERALCCCAER